MFALASSLQALASQLQDTEAALAAEKEESKNSRRRQELLEEELKELKKELENVVLSCGQAQQKSREHEVKSRWGSVLPPMLWRAVLFAGLGFLMSKRMVERSFWTACAFVMYCIAQEISFKVTKNSLF